MKQQLIQQIILLSNKEFTRYQYKYIDNRFNNKLGDWLSSCKFEKLKTFLALYILQLCSFF